MSKPMIHKPIKENYKFKEFYVPLYFSRVGVVVTNNLQKSYDFTWQKVFGPWDATRSGAFVALNNHNQYVIFFDRAALDHEVIAHEVFHLTIKIADHIGLEMANNHEGHAYLNGYLTQELYKILKRMKEQIS